MALLDALKEKRLYLSGAMGTMLIKRGLTDVPDLYVRSNPDAVRDIHEGYLRAGSDIITTDTFGANPLKLPGHDVSGLVADAVKLAREAIDNAGGKPRYVALSMGPTGRLLSPVGDLPFEDAYNAFAAVVRAGQDADVILVETMSDLYELKAAVLAAKENSSLPVFATVTLDEKGRLLTGAGLDTVAALLEGLRVDALGLNCSHEPRALCAFVREMSEFTSIPMIISPNAGLPGFNGADGHQSPEGFASDMTEIAPFAHLLGGCCGTTPEHIERMIEYTHETSLPVLRAKNRTVVTSGCRSAVFGGAPVIVGERLNPTGKKALKAALRADDMDYLLSEALAQSKCGAHVLDVNVGLPELDEAAVLTRAVRALQGVITLPLQLDSADPKALESAMRVYNGKPMINSVNGKRESMEAVFPLAAKYGGVVVALTLDEDGIPGTARGRLAIARRIVETAGRYGIGPEDIVVDGLTLSSGTNQDEARITLETVRLVRETLGVHTILGVSNISFGLPRRDVINASFYTMALHEGLSSAIINPCSDAMMDAYHAYCALSGLDSGFTSYTARYGSCRTEPQVPSTKPELGKLIKDGISAGIADAVAELLKSAGPLDIINGEIIPALNAVGEEFESGRSFLPQLMRSAEAARDAFDVLRAHMPKSDETLYKDKIVIAAVQGDIHDIGKNIARVLMSNYGYQVIDLGKDVPPETVVEAVRESEARFVGLSALMTTTVPSMAETVRQLKESGFSGSVLVSGAVMSDEYAAMVGADAYVKDAMAAMAYMESK